MNNTEKFLVDLLCDFAQERSRRYDYKNIDFDELYALSHKQAVAGIAGYMLTLPANAIEPELIKSFASSFDKTVSQLIRKDIYAKNLMRKFSENGIEHITFKGPVVKDVYPVPELRTYSDIDLIIKPEDRKKSHKLMLDAGFSCSVQDGGAVYSYKKGIETYEIHTNLNYEPSEKSEYLSNYWAHTKPLSGLTKEFDENFHFIYIISHIEKHVYGSGAGVRMYLDVALYLKKYQDRLDFKKIRKVFKEIGTEKFFDTVLCLCNRWFETPLLKEVYTDEKLLQHFCDITIQGGAFGKNMLEQIVETDIRKNINKKGKLGLMLSHIFPPYKEVRRIYPFFNGKPVLLPLAWIVHFVKAGRRSGFKNLKKIKNADRNSALKEQEFLNQIGSKR